MTKIAESVRPTAEQRIEAERRAVSAVEQEIVRLQQVRAAKLLDEDPSDALKVSEKIGDAERRVGIHRDRIAALQAEVRRQAQLAADREIADRIAATERALRDRDAIAVKLETSIADMGRLYFELVDQNQIVGRQWRMSNNALRAGLLGEALLAREVSVALFAAGRPRNGVCRLPAPGNAGLGIVGDAGQGKLADRIAHASAALLEMVKAVPAPPADEAA